MSFHHSNAASPAYFRCPLSSRFHSHCLQTTIILNLTGRQKLVLFSERDRHDPLSKTDGSLRFMMKVRVDPEGSDAMWMNTDWHYA
jgi:hypothetical protein